MLNRVSKVGSTACLPARPFSPIPDPLPSTPRQAASAAARYTYAPVLLPNTQIPYIPGSSRLLIFYRLGTLVTSSREHHLPHRLRHVLRFATFTAEQFFQMIIIFHLALIGAESIICLAPPLDV